ncbi:unnamed protein product [Schistocephalus solidus]|uniref:C2H2-type domain-containing protein n=1 Tax=Schistocephalus solidus TaxID=70667 RepID=A0A183S757_SCHSO|nr:unnamed protein product [Schistocephalus solidus]
MHKDLKAWTQACLSCQRSNAVVLTTLLYGAEMQTVYSKQARKLKHFYLSCLRSIDTLKNSLKQWQIIPATWEDLAVDRLAWRSAVKTGAAIYETNWIAAVNAKRVARKSQVPHCQHNGDSIPTSPHCDCTFTGDPVPEALTHSRDHCLHCPHAFTHRMGLHGFMHIHENGIHRDANPQHLPTY